jgi:hypothetical protein
MDLIVCIAWVLALTAASRAILRWRIISTELVPAFGSAVAWPARTAGAAVRAVDLEDTVPGLSKRAGEAGAVGSGAFDAEGLYRAEGQGPCGEAAVSGAARRNRCGGEPGAQGAEGDRRMDVLVGVDADDDVCGW